MGDELNFELQVGQGLTYTLYPRYPSAFRVALRLEPANEHPGAPFVFDELASGSVADSIEQVCVNNAQLTGDAQAIIYCTARGLPELYASGFIGNLVSRLGPVCHCQIAPRTLASSWAGHC